MFINDLYRDKNGDMASKRCADSATQHLCVNSLTRSQNRARFLSRDAQVSPRLRRRVV